MNRFCRVFGKKGEPIDAGAFRQYLSSLYQDITCRFDGDDEGWFWVRINCLGEGEILIERYSIHEEGIRAEINSWIAWLETQEKSPVADSLIERISATQQLFTLEVVYDERGFCEVVAKYIARLTDGVYQIDERGIFDSGGDLLLDEPS